MTSTFDTFLFEDSEVGVRFEIEARFSPGPKGPPSPGLEHVRSAYLAFGDEIGRQYVLSISSVPVDYEMTREKLEELVSCQTQYNTQLVAERGWTVCEPGRVTTVGRCLARHNEFVTPGTHPDERETMADEDVAPSHVQAWTAFLPGRAVSLMLGVHPPGDLDEARTIMQKVTQTLEFLSLDDGEGG